VIYAAMVGLGFAMVENVGYYINAIATPERGGIALLGYTFVLRGVLSPLLHPIFTSMTGLGVAYAASRPRGAQGARWAVGGVSRLARRERRLLTLMRIARGSFARRVPLDPNTPAPWVTIASALTPETQAQPQKAAMERTVAPPPPAP
jgi:PrsW family intramembrane metalloprotease